MEERRRHGEWPGILCPGALPFRVSPFFETSQLPRHRWQNVSNLFQSVAFAVVDDVRMMPEADWTG